MLGCARCGEQNPNRARFCNACGAPLAPEAPSAHDDHARTLVRTDVGELARTPLVGRQNELEVLVGALNRVCHEREPQLVTLVGVPGIGKSRLVWELLREVEASSDPVRWRQGRSVPYGEGATCWALAQIVKAEAGILETDEPEASAQKLREALATHANDLGEAQWLERHLRPLIGLSAESELPSDRTQEVFAAWRRFVEALAEERALVLVFEDLQWADGHLLDFVDSLLEWTRGVALLVICTAHPELLARRPGWGGGKANAAILSLTALSDEETARLVHAVLEGPVLAAELQRALVARAEGNPLYAEEFARLVAAGREPDELPESVQGIVAARLEALRADERELLQDASVMGKVFWLGAVCQMDGRDRVGAERGLHALERTEFVRRERRASVAGETEYVFRHGVVRDVAYEQIPGAERARKHERAAAWIESLGRREDHAELLAHHYLAALELARGTAEPVEQLVERARCALRAAGDGALALNAFATAARFFAAALELWPPQDPARAQLLFRHGKALRIAEAGGDDVLREAADALLAAGDRAAAAEAEVLLAELALSHGEGLRADHHIERARALLAALAPSRQKAYVLSSLSSFRMVAGDHEQAIGLGREALALAEELGLDEIRAHALNNIGTARVNAGDEGGVSDLEQSIEIALAANSHECVRGYVNLSVMLFVLGDVRRSRELTLEGLNAGERFGDGRNVRVLRANLTVAEFFLGRWEDALRIANEFIDETKAGARHRFELYARSSRGAIRLARGDVEGALVDAGRALEIARESKLPSDLGYSLALYAEALLASGRAQEAEPVAGEALALAREDAASGDWPALARALSALGRREELLAALEPVPPTRRNEAARLYARGDFAAAAELYAEIGALPDEGEARLRAAEQFLAAGNRTAGELQLAHALSFFRDVDAVLYAQRAEALLGGATS